VATCALKYAAKPFAYAAFAAAPHWLVLPPLAPCPEIPPFPPLARPPVPPLAVPPVPALVPPFVVPAVALDPALPPLSPPVPPLLEAPAAPASSLLPAAPTGLSPASPAAFSGCVPPAPPLLEPARPLAPAVVPAWPAELTPPLPPLELESSELEHAANALAQDASNSKPKESVFMVTPTNSESLHEGPMVPRLRTDPKNQK